MSNDLSIDKVKVNPWTGIDAYIPAAYPTQDYLTPVCKTHTECCDGAVFIPPDNEEPVLLPDCITIAYVSTGSGSGTELTLTGTEYEGDDAVAEIDASGRWCVNFEGGNYKKTDDADVPIGTFCTTAGDVLATVPCDKFVAEPVEEPECVALAYSTFEEIPAQDYNADALGSSFIGEFGGGVLTFVGDRWEWSVNGNTLAGGDDPADPTGLYTAGDSCALFKPCSDIVVELPECLEAVFSDNRDYPLGQYDLQGADYVHANTDGGTLSYSNIDGWTISGGVADYVKQDEPLNGDVPSGVYVSANGDELLIRECD